MQEQIRIADVMNTYMESYSLTQDKFAALLNENLVNINIGRVAVTNWCNSKSEPNTDFLLLCAVVYEDWRRSWAMSCLKVKLPEVFDSGVMEFKLPILE